MAQTYRIDRSDRVGMTPLHHEGENIFLMLGALVGGLFALGAIALLIL
ncbi:MULTISPECIES: hypothetical protein [unclassified Asaia]|nr:hypothetical protein [Asaia sp. W19]